MCKNWKTNLVKGVEPTESTHDISFIIMLWTIKNLVITHIWGSENYKEQLMKLMTNVKLFFNYQNILILLNVKNFIIWNAFSIFKKIRYAKSVQYLPICIRYKKSL